MASQTAGHAVHWGGTVAQNSPPLQVTHVPPTQEQELALPSHSLESSAVHAPPEQSLHPGQAV
jgi:hypothetical protein